MSQTLAVPASGASAIAEPVVNRCTLQVATVNGSGSQTANNTLLRALFQMGIPVSGKNLFPSNIMGLPTWFTIRLNQDGWVARHRDTEVMVCMNAQTVEEDVRGLSAGAVLIAEESLKAERFRSDLDLYAVPFTRLVREVCEPVNLRRLVVNMIYVGVLAELIGIEVSEIDAALAKAFSTKPKALEVNRAAVQAGVDWTKANVSRRPRYQVRRIDANGERILLDGNTASALGALMAGVTVATWYPITPSSSLTEALISLAETHRKDPQSGKRSIAILQAEDELAAIGIAVGAGWSGARAMTATSGPGISLMSEFIGLAYYAEIPAVIFNVQRTGPSTGLPTRTMQGDVLFAAYNSHGDTKHPCLYPSDVNEAYLFAQEAFDLAEGLQTPVFVMSDLDLGMNLWMTDPFPYPGASPRRGKVLGESALAALESWGRYRDVDGDGVPYRTLPGTAGGRGAYFTRGSGHDENARYTESGEVYVQMVDRLDRKMQTATAMLPEPIVEESGRNVALLCYGSSEAAVGEAREILRLEHALETDALRLRAFPFHAAVEQFIQAHERVYVVDQNRDGQMRRLLAAELPQIASRLRSVRHYDGLPLDAQSVVEGVCAGEAETTRHGRNGRDS